MGTLQRMSRVAGQGTIHVVGAPHVRIPWVHEDDVGALFALALLHGVQGSTYNCTGFIQTISEAAGAAAAAVGVKKYELKTVDADYALQQFGAVGAFGYTLDLFQVDCSNSKALGWRAHHLDF